MSCQAYDSSSLVTINRGPKANLQDLVENITRGDMNVDTWAENARVSALLGSNRKTHNEFKCGVRAWLQFAKVLGYEGRELPPTPEMMLQWSMLFRLCSYFVLLYLALLSCKICVIGAEVLSQITLAMLSCFVNYWAFLRQHSMMIG